MNRFGNHLVGCGLSALVLASTWTGASAASGQPAAQVSRFVLPAPPPSEASPSGPFRARTAVTPYNGDAAAVDAQSAAGATIRLWRSFIVTEGVFYPFIMVGRDPLHAHLPGRNGNSTPTPLIPVAFTFTSDGTVLDPTAPDPGCSPAGTPMSLTQSSPLFQKTNYTLGGTNLGNGQYVDEFQRANFWKLVSTVDPGYHVNLALQPKAALPVVDTVDTPIVSPNGCKVARISLSAWDSYMKGTLFPALAASGVSPTTFPIFLFYNVELVLPGNKCCALGYHGAFANPSFRGRLQTFAVADYATSGDALTTPDISIPAHEVGEWLDDPLGNNPTPAWGFIGQVPNSCQNNLEVGDPLTGTNAAITMPNGFTYHPQDLTFFSWFFDHNFRPLGVNGWYSFQGTFLSSAPDNVCDGP